MVKRWFASFALALAAINSGLAADVPTQALQPDFLALPALGVEWTFKGPAKKEEGGQKDSERKPKVGDTLIMDFFFLSKEISIGDLEVKAPAGVDLSKEGWEISRPDLASTESAKAAFEVNPLKPGKLTLPALLLTLKGSGTPVARTNPLEIEVESAISKDDPAPNVPADLKPPMQIGFPWWVVIVAGLVSLLVLGVVIYLLVRWSRARRMRTSAPTPEPAKPEHEIALAALDQIHRQYYPAKNEFKKHYFGVSETLKTYIGARYGFDAPESTTAEMLRVLEEEAALSPQALDKLQSLFDRMDRVKFTDHLPEAGEAEKILEEAKKFVTQTRKLPEPAPILNGALDGKAGHAPR